MRRYLPLLALLLLPAQAVGTSQVIRVTATVGNACVIAPNNSNQTIDLPDYSAITVPGSPRTVTIVTFCNRNTVPTRRLNGVAPGQDQSVALRLDGVSAGPALNVLVNMDASNAPTVSTAAGFVGAFRYSTTIEARYPAAPQFGAPSGQYAGSVVFSVEF